MSLVALDGTPLVIVGCPQREGFSQIALSTAATLAAANTVCVMYGQIFTEDGASHTIDTTGSSSLGWRTGTSTFANAGTSVQVGLAAMDTANGPPGRAVNAAGAVTFDVSKTMAGGGGGITSAAWQTHVPGAGTKTIANGDFVAFAIQMTARGGTDSVIVQAEPTASGAALVLPGVTSFNGTTYSAVAALPNLVITFSDGQLGFFYGGSVATSFTTQTWNNTSTTKEYGNFVQMPVPARIYGIVCGAAFAGDMDLVLYSDPLGTPVAQKTVSVDANTVALSTAQRYGFGLFASPYDATASQPLAAIMKPTSATNVTAAYRTFNASAHQKSETLGTNGYAINRNTGAFAAQNSNKDRHPIGVLVGAFDNGASGPVGQQCGM